MREAVHMQITTIGLDIAKNVFQVHGIDAAEKVVVRKRWLRIFEQNFRADKWNLCQGYAASRSGSLKYA
jgi:hypothetical protein